MGKAMQEMMPHNSKSRTVKEIAFTIVRFPLTRIIIGCIGKRNLHLK
jgi:hypothetical protein